MTDIAETILREKGQGGRFPTSLVALLADEYLELEAFDAGGRFEGRFELCTGKPTIYLNLHFRGVEDPRVRFTLGHELGHYFLHRNRLSRGEVFRDDVISHGDDVEQVEREANEFASECLLPRVLVKRFLAGKYLGLDRVEQLAAEANASLLATAIKLSQLTSSRSCFFWEEGGAIAWTAPSSDWRYARYPSSQWRGKLPEGSHATETSDSFTERAVHLNVWCPKAFEREAPLYEAALKTNYGRLVFVADVEPDSFIEE